MEQLHYTHMIHESSSQSHASFPIIAVAIIGIFATIFLLLFYYVFVIKCCLNWHRIDILRRFSVSRNRDHHHHSLLHYHHHPSSPEARGLNESVIRSIPIFHFQKQKDSDHFTGETETECSVCLAEFQHNEKLRKIPNCAHVFHIDCIDVWLQNNPNCPLCRNSISVSIPIHFPAPENPNFTSPASDEQDYVVIELCSHDGGVSDGSVGSTRRNVTGEEDRPNSGEPLCKKPGKKLRKKQGNVSSMGDECIDVNNRRKGDDQFLIQPIRRSFSMDSASDRQLYLAVQEIIQRNSRNHVDLIDECSSSNGRLRRGFFSFGHARSVVLPLNSKP